MYLEGYDDSDVKSSGKKKKKKRRFRKNQTVPDDLSDENPPPSYPRISLMAEKGWSTPPGQRRLGDYPRASRSPKLDTVSDEPDSDGM